MPAAGVISGPRSAHSSEIELSEIQAAFSARIGQNPERRQSESGRGWAKLRVAVGHDPTTWITVLAFDSLIDTAMSFNVGDRAYFEGRLELRTWTGRDGKEMCGLSCIPHHITRTMPKANKPPRNSARNSAARRDWQSPANNHRGRDYERSLDHL